MANCININHPDFLALVRKSGLNRGTLSGMMGVWMDENNTDEWPTLEQLGIESNQIKPGVEEIFDSNPELNSIGTAKQYSDYLDTIFPDSKVKDIVYHAGRPGITKFDKTKLGSNAGIQKGRNGFYFAKNIEQLWLYEEKLNAREDTGSERYSVILNIKDPSIVTHSHNLI
jgi:hypothetical protein